MQPDAQVNVTLTELHRGTREIVAAVSRGMPVKVIDARSGRVCAWLVPPDHVAVPA
jgi:hypothetical protein